MSDEDIDFEKLDGSEISLGWAIPFCSLLLSISVFPVIAPHIWHKYMLPIALGHVFVMLLGMFIQYSAEAMLESVVESVLHEYVPFIALIFSLFLVCGGIRVRDDKLDLQGTPIHNITLLFVGLQLASWMGTTGASLLLIRPLIKSNKHRKHNSHVFVFFIFLVSNCGGALSPLGDPPLFLGFLKGVEFAWFTEYLIGPWAMVWSLELLLFGMIDSYYYFKVDMVKGSDIYARFVGNSVYSAAASRPGMSGEVSVSISKAYVEPPYHKLGRFAKVQKNVTTKLNFLDKIDTSFLGRLDIIEGWRNVPLLICIPLTILFTGVMELEVEKKLSLFNVEIEYEDIIRDCILFSLGVISLLVTPQSVRFRNGFDWFPFLEVARLFFGIFITMIPVVAILAAGEEGGLGFVVSATTKEDGGPNNIVYFFLTGILSSVLDNAPTFLIFFNLAGGTPESVPDKTLMAISMGSVFMGALTYIGNAPNFMIKAICEEKKIKMPNFGSYILWSSVCLLPVLSVTGLLYLL